ncbi:MAG: hypothetical protein IJC43_05785 [Clostridia bacterium]|nr:hypothetical protein [Clostridia bacterium]
MNMKKILALLLSLMLLLSLVACSSTDDEAPAGDGAGETAGDAAGETAGESGGDAAEPEMKEVIGVTVPAFTLHVNGKTLTNEQMADYAVYEIQATSVNSSGTESTVTYVGFSLADVFAAAGVTDYTSVVATADDGYAVEIAKEMASKPSTLVAISKDGEQFKTAPWFAPCSSGTTGDYLKGMVAITLDGQAFDPSSVPAPDAGDAPAEGELPEIADRTDKVEFAAYSFKVNGQEVTNETLAGLSIYKIEVTTVNSKGASSTSGYTGYKLADVLAACGVENATTVKAVANDGYESTLSAENITSDYTLVAIEKDKELGEDGTIWVAPCAETTSSAYAKLVVEIVAE